MGVTLEDQDKEIEDLKEDLAPLKSIQVETKKIIPSCILLQGSWESSWRQGTHRKATLHIRPT